MPCTLTCRCSTALLAVWVFHVSVAALQGNNSEAGARHLPETCLPQPSGRNCEFGSLPGTWTDEGGNVHWQVLDANCRLQDVLSACLHFETPAARAVSILMFGDSVDRHITRHGCSAAAGKPENFNQNKDQCGNRCVLCRLPHLHMAVYTLWGSAPKGPYHMGMKQPPQQRIVNGLRLFKQETGREPDMIVLSVNFWDIAVHAVPPKTGQQGQAGVTGQPSTPANQRRRLAPQSTQRKLLKAHTSSMGQNGSGPAFPVLQADPAFFMLHFLEQWVAQMVALMMLLKTGAPRSLLAYHTLPHPRFDPCRVPT